MTLKARAGSLELCGILTLPVEHDSWPSHIWNLAAVPIP